MNFTKMGKVRKQHPGVRATLLRIHVFDHGHGNGGSNLRGKCHLTVIANKTQTQANVAMALLQAARWRWLPACAALFGVAEGAVTSEQARQFWAVREAAHGLGVRRLPTLTNDSRCTSQSCHVADRAGSSRLSPRWVQSLRVDEGGPLGKRPRD